MAKEGKRFWREVGELLLFVLLVGLAALLLRIGCRQYMRSAYPTKYTEYITQAAAHYGLDASLLFALIRTESEFDKDAVSSAGAKGLMQMMDATFEWAQYLEGRGEFLPAEKIFDPQTNIHYGAAVLRANIDDFGNLRTALAAYNAGAGKVREWLANPACSKDGKTLIAIPYGETRDYVDRVLKAQEMYRELYTFQ